MLWVGIDDTDSPRGGCTTHALTELVDEAGRFGLDLIGEPRLVRLNPNVPWKTRGNAALSARFGIGAGPRRRVGSLGDRPVWAHARAAPRPASEETAFVDAAWARLLETARRGEPGTDPAMVVARRRLPARLYWEAVREIVSVPAVRGLLEQSGVWFRYEGTPRGLVGAAAAIAWPAGHPTWEAIAYRRPERIGSRRALDRGSVREAQARHPELFLCEDRRTRRLLVAPHTDCPILFGLRATDPGAARRALALVRSEPVDRWMLFRTNQGSGDHLCPRPLAEIGPYRAAIVEGVVAESPSVLPGGHVRFALADPAGGSVACVAFEPTKTLPAAARDLRPGDRLRAWGSRGVDRTLRLEGLAVLAAAPGSFRAPRCPDCHRAARSLGHARGYRCPGCRRRWPPEAAVAQPRTVARGPVHPTPSARRHLAPLGPPG
ncbi:MAG TPA: tRNA(Ile)(2)-agmatinylcytidine synthase [Thermoplasmata archaeon]|nr:tRNA(Ile)(2)-agmatinylcytidine synthase [Thermoplasmata archaeon]